MGHQKLETTAIYTDVIGPEERSFADAFFAWSGGEPPMSEVGTPMSAALASALRAVMRMKGDSAPDAALWAEFLEALARSTAEAADPRQGSTPAGR